MEGQIRRTFDNEGVVFLMLQYIHMTPDNAPEMQQNIIPEVKPADSPEILRHPAETFPWLPKEEYFRLKDEYVQAWTPYVEEDLRSVEDYWFRDNPAINKTVATILTRAKFVKEYLVGNPPQERYRETPVSHWPGNIKNFYTVAETYPEFNLSQEEAQQPGAMDKLKITKMRILINANRIGTCLKNDDDLLNDGVKSGDWSEDFAANFKEQSIEEQGIFLEESMVEEVAHAFFWLNAASTPGGLQRYLKERETYHPPPSDQDVYIATEEEYKSYINSPIELDGAVWKKAFMQRYYPDFTRSNGEGS
jgi:hypothetical protein